jgi:hypothetical protein
LKKEKRKISLPDGLLNASYSRYQDYWKFPLQQACYLAALIMFLETGRLIQTNELEQLLGSKWRGQAI